MVGLEERAFQNTFEIMNLMDLRIRRSLMRLENTELALLQIVFGRLDCGAQSEKSTAECPTDRMFGSCSAHCSRRAETNVPANPVFRESHPRVTSDDSPYLNNLD